jgi:hypothetical protein
MVPTTSLLDQAVLLTKDCLRAFAGSGKFLNMLEVSFGDRFNSDQAEALRQVWEAGDFTQLPIIQIQSGSALQGVNGAYAAQSNKIFLSQDFLEVNIGKPEAIASVLLEEIGHFVDAQINSVDSVGDEGAIFSALVRGESLSNEQLAFMQAEEDPFTLADGTEIEAATLKVDTLVDENDGNYSAGDLSLREAIALATPGDTITFANSGTITLTLGELNINKALTINGDIDGNGTPDITVSGNNASRVFNIDDGNSANVINVNISGLIITRGTYTYGAGVFNDENLTLSNNSFNNNFAEYSGGSIFNYGTLNLSNSTLNGNSARDHGGGIFNYGTLNLSNSTLSGNFTANGSGGAVYNYGTLNLGNSTLSSNSTANGSGGAVYNEGTLNLSNSTLSGNFAGENGESIYNIGTAALSNSILDRSTRGGEDFSGNAPTLSGNNLIADGSIPTTNTNGVINGDPRLGPLQDNGGTTFTHQLLPGSPAINAGDNTVAQDLLDLDNDGIIFEPVPFDQRGKERFYGGRIDLGAFEVNPSDQLVSLTVQEGLAKEGNLGTASFIVARNTKVGDLEVLIKVDGIAKINEDYQFIETENVTSFHEDNQLVVTIPDGEDKVEVRVKALDDKLVEEGTELIKLELIDGSDRTIVYRSENGKSDISLEVEENEPILSFYPVYDNEGSESGDTGYVTIALSQPAPEDFTLFYDLSGSALEGEDYTVRDSNNHSIVVKQGSTSVDILVDVIDDSVDDDDEFIGFKLRELRVSPEDSTTEDIGGVIVNYGISDYYLGYNTYLGFSTVDIADNDKSDISIQPQPNLRTATEDGAKAVFNVSLTSRPLENVVLLFQNLNSSQGSLSIDSLEFTPDDFDNNVKKTVTVTALDDDFVEGIGEYTIKVDVNSEDSKYDALEKEFSYTIQDNDVPGIKLNVQDAETNEAGDTATFTVVLDTQPTDTVTIDIKGVDDSEGNLSASSLTFNNSNWNIPQIVTVTGANDFIDDDDQAYTISFDASKSSDTNYAKLTQENLDQLGKKIEIKNLDNDTAGITLSPITGNVTEDGGTATFTVQLNSQPLQAVKIQIISSNEDEGSVSPDFLSFDSTNFSTPQTVTITGVDDSSIDGDKRFTISTTVISEDEKYKNIKVASFEITNVDNDVIPTASIKAGDSIIEGNPGTFTISLDRPALVGGATVKVEISGTATSSKDFNLIETIQFNEGETEKTLTFAGVDDRIAEDSETITLTLGSVNNSQYIPSSISGTATLTLNDNDVVGVNITTRNSSTSESGGKSEIEVVLTSQPESIVEINLISSKPGEGKLSVSKLTFNPEDWNKAQIVTVTGADDIIADGSATFHIEATATSSDSKYNNITINPLQLVNQDNEGFGVLILPSDGNVVVSEAGTTDTYQIALTQPPTGTVQVTATADSGTEISLDGVKFAPTQVISLNDTKPRTVNVRALADGEVTGDRTSTIVHRITDSSDPNYPTNLVVDALSAVVKDQDLPTVSIISTDNASEKSTVFGQFNLLLSGAAPTGGITINYLVEATSTATASNDEPFKLGEPDYFVLPGSIFIPEGATGATIEVLPTLDDKVTEPLETVNITLAAGSSYLVDATKASNTVSISDDDIAGVRITESGNLTRGFEGRSDDYTVRLTSQPQSDVEVQVKTDQFSTAIDKLIFTSENWNIGQTVTVNFVDDGIVTGDRKSNITHTVISQDPNYQNIEVRNIEAVVLEDETAGVTVSSSTTQLKEGERSVSTYTLVLDTKPTANVIINFSPDSLFEAIAPITFTPDNWNTAQNVLVTPVDDNRVTGNRTGIIIQKIVSDDPAFNNLSVKNAVVSVLDNDTANIAVAVSDGNTQVREGTQTDSFTIALSSQPASDVRIEFLTTSPLNPLAPIVFSPTNWNQPRTVNVVAINDGISQGNIREKTPIRLSVVSNDASYNGFKLSDVPVDIADIAGVTVTKTSLQVGEGERPTTYQIRLNSEPYSNVTINFASTGGLLEAIAPITFNRSNWNQPQTITVKGIEGALAAADFGTATITQTVTSADLAYSNLNLSNISVSVLSDNTFLTWEELVAAVGKQIGSVPSGLKTTLETRLGSLFLPVTLKEIEGNQLLLSYPGTLSTNSLLQKLPSLGTIATNLKLANSLETTANPQIEVEGFDLKQPEFNLILPALNTETIRGLLTNVNLAAVANELVANVLALDLQVERDRLHLGYLNNQSVNNLLGKVPGAEDLANTLKLPNLTVARPSITIIDPATNPRYELTAASLPVNSLQSWLTTQVDALDSALPDTVQNAIKALANTAQDLDLVVSDNAVQVTYGGNLNVREIINQLATKLGLSNPLPAELAIANPALKILNPGDDPSFEFTAPRLSVATLQAWLTSQVNSILPTEIQNLTNEAQNLDLTLTEDQLRLTYLGDINVGSALNKLTETLGLGRPFSTTLAVNNPEVAIEKNDQGEFTYAFSVPRLARADAGNLFSGLNAPNFVNSVLSEISNLGLTFGKDKLELTYNGNFDLRTPVNQLSSVLGLGTPISSPLTVSNPKIRIEGTGNQRTFELAVSRLPFNQSIDLMEDIFGRELPDEVKDSLRSIGNNLNNLEFVLSQKPQNQQNASSQYSITLRYEDALNFTVDIDDIGNPPAFIEKAIKAANKAFFGSEELTLKLANPELSVATGPELGFGAELNGKEFDIVYDKNGEFQLSYELPDLIDFSSFAQGVPVLDLFKLSDPELIISSAAKRIEDPRLSTITLVEGFNFIGTIDFKSGDDLISKFINEQLGIESLGVQAGLGSGGASLAAVVPLNATLLPLPGMPSVGDLKAILKNLKLVLDAKSETQVDFGFEGNLELSGYDPFQNNEPTLFLSGDLKLSPLPVTTLTAGFALQTNSSPWVNPFGIPDSEIRNLAFEVGGTYTFPFINNIGFLGDARFGNYDLEAAFSFDRSNFRNIALFLRLKEGKSLTLVDLLAGPVGSFALKQVGDEIPVIDTTLNLLDTILDVTVSGLDLNNDGKNEPTVQFVPFDTDIAGIPLEKGFAVNAQVDAYGVKGKLALNADTNLSEITGSLALSRINLGGLGVVIIEGANNDPELNLDIRVGTSTSPLISGDASVQLFGLEVAEAKFSVGLDDVDIKAKFALPGLQLDTDFTASNITKLNLTFSGSANASVFGNPIVGATVSGDRSRFVATGNLNLLGIPGVLQGSANATVELGVTPNDFALRGSGNLSIFNNPLADVKFSGNSRGISAIGRLNLPGIPGVLAGGVNANVAIDNNDFSLTGSGNLSIFNNPLADVIFSGNSRGISAIGRLNLPGIPGVLAGGVNANIAIGNNDFSLSGSGNLSVFGYSIANANFSGNRNALTASGNLSLSVSNILTGDIASTVTIGSNINNFGISGRGAVNLLGKSLTNVSLSGNKNRLGFDFNTNVNTPLGSTSTDLEVNLDTSGFDLDGKLGVNLPKLSFKVLGKPFSINSLSFGVSPDLDVKKNGSVKGGLNDINVTVLGKRLPEFDINFALNSGFDSFDDILSKVKNDVEAKAKGVAGDLVKKALKAAEEAAKEVVGKAVEVTERAVTYVGKVINGSIEGATIWFDANKNSIFDREEPNTLTQSDGTYFLAIPEGFNLSTGLIRSQGGVDTTTGLPFQTTLAALPGSNITPLTVLIQQLVTEGATIDEALATVQTEFGISPDIDLYGFDHLDETLNANPEARVVILAINKVQSAVLGIQNLLAGAGGSTVAEQDAAVNSVLSDAAYSAVADLIVSSQLNLEDANQVETIIRTAATKAQSVLQAKGLSFNIDLTVIERVADEAAQVLVAGAIKKQILSNEADEGINLLRRVTQAKRVSNGEEANALNFLGQGQLTETEILAFADTSDKALAAIRSVTLLPQLGGLFDISLVEGEQLADFPITLYDFETSQDQLTINITSDNPELLPTPNVVLTPGTTDFTRFLNVSPVAGKTGTARIKILVTDSDGQSIDQDFSVAVGTNNTPVFTLTGSFIVSPPTERGTVIGNLDANDGNGGTTDISVGYSITSGNDDSNGNGDQPFNIDLNGEIFVNDPDDLQMAASGTEFKLAVAANDGVKTAETTISIALANTNTNTNTNTPPNLVTSIIDQIATEDTSFILQIPITTFNDADTGDTLTYTVSFSDGTPLPSWLTFDSNTQTLGGTPTNNEVGALQLKITTTDTQGASASDSFNLTVSNVNDAPTITKPIANQTATEDTLFTFAIPTNTFTDVDTGDSLTYTATFAQGNALPAWLSFDANTRTFSGTPTNSDVGTLDIRVTATDTQGATTNTVFNLAIANVNDAPVLNEAIGDGTAIADQLFSLTLAANAFIDIDADDRLTYTATLTNGELLPAWLSFDPNTGTFSGVPNRNDTASLSILVAATDLTGANSSDVFGLEVTRGQIELPRVNNRIKGTRRGDRLKGTRRGDRISGRGGNDVIRGLGGNDILLGDGGNDTLIGGNGNDVLLGGQGGDSLWGNQGNDVFALSSNQGNDTINDFQDGQDFIGLLNGLTYSSLVIRQIDGTTEISTQDSNEILATLAGISANVITAADFVSV